jgi:hypothetical protein
MRRKSRQLRLDLARSFTLNKLEVVMSNVKSVYALIAKEVEDVQFLRESIVVQAFQTFEREDPRLANFVQSGTRDRKCAAFWMCRPLRRLDGRTAYQALAEGDEDSVWDLLSSPSDIDQ